ncbi:unnamed protein product [Clavelina lepadiformis]|uniref:Ig-like domain-containing protein n=1 Tax=Clavelina lepadiformis TaxID=159417 RepID=A0ABP0F2G3_CLALP
MSDVNGNVTVETKKEKGARRRRKPRDENEPKRKPIRLVSSLGEGKLVDRFQNAMGEKEHKKKLRERNDKERRLAKEKRDREVAKFKAELDALLEDDPDSKPKPKGRAKTYVPKLSGTVKGKFQALEQKKKNDEESKMIKERQRRVERDLREKKRIQIELAKKKQKGIIEDDEDKIPMLKASYAKKPGKLKTNFEDIDKKRKEREQKKVSLEREIKMSAERRAMKEYYATHEDEDHKDEEIIGPKALKNAPGKLKKNFNDTVRQRDAQERKRADEEKRRKLEEEKQQFRAAKLAAGSEDMTSGSSMASQTSSMEKIHTTPSRLSSSFTKFDVLEKQRIEEETTRIRERRKSLLEEEQRLFDQAKKQQLEMMSDNEEEDNVKKRTNIPGRLDASLTKFDLLSQQKFEEERKRIHEERSKLLEEEKRNFKIQQMAMQSKDTNSENDSANSSNDEPYSSDSNQKTRKKVTRTPSKLDSSKLKFDVLERQRMEQERLEIQRKRQWLLEEEKRLFEESKIQQREEDSDNGSSQNVEAATPGRLDCSFTKFDIMTQERLEDERQRIKEERNLLMDEELKLMEEERRRIQEQENEDKEDNMETKTEKTVRRPQRLDKSFTEFDVLEKKRKQAEEEELFREKARKLEEEKQSFKEAKERMKNSESDEENHKNESNLHSVKQPNKLSSKFTNFDLMEQERMEKERLRAQEEKIKQLETEIKYFETQKKTFNDAVDDVTSGTKALLKSSRESPRPKKLSSSFTKFDLIEKKRRDEERRRLQEEKAKKLANEREMFAKTRLEQMENNSSDEDSSKEIENRPYVGLGHRSVKKMDVRSKIEAVLKAQEEAEQKRIDETKFTRMTVEQQEMYLARQKQIEFLKQQLASARTGYDSEEESYYSSEEEESEDGEYYYYYSNDEEEEDDEDYNEEEEDYKSEEEEEEEEEEKEEKTKEVNDDGGDDSEATSVHSGSVTSSSSGTYSGSPYFVQTLKNLTVKEGEPVRFDANINANPHPKVTWYFKNHVIRNSPDYQYISKGTQYSLYMNESFVDDNGEYMCKAMNEKGTATSKASLLVQELEDDEE